MKSFYERLTELFSEHGSLVIATLVEVSGSSPRNVGAKMVIFPGGTIEGTIGGGALEKKVVEDALVSLKKRVPASVVYDLTDDGIGMKCGGRLRVYFEPVTPSRRFVIFGGGHVGQAVAKLAAGAGFAVELVDDRKSEKNPSPVPGGITLIQTDASYAEGYEPPGRQDMAIVLTRNHRLDTDLAGRFAGRCAYLGVMGSKTKWGFIKKTLIGRGLSEEVLAGVRCPIGLEIGADTPEEIAVSIVAEAIAVRAKTRQGVKKS